MAKVLVTDTNLTNIANAIRGKNGETVSYKVDEMAEAIGNITGSSSSIESVTVPITINLVSNGYTEIVAIRYIDNLMNGDIYTSLMEHSSVSNNSSETIQVSRNGCILLQISDPSISLEVRTLSNTIEAVRSNSSPCHDIILLVHGTGEVNIYLEGYSGGGSN